MRKIIVVGTLHGGLTPKYELVEILNKINPNQLLIEITKEDLKKERLKNYPDEMVDAYKWAKNKNIKIDGFDSSINILKKKITKEENQKLIEEVRKLLQVKNYTWKDMNKEEDQKTLDNSSVNKLINPTMAKKRELTMLKNINSAMFSDGVILILTGSSHLKFFKKNLKGATFPFR